MRNIVEASVASFWANMPSLAWKTHLVGTASKQLLEYIKRVVTFNQITLQPNMFKQWIKRGMIEFLFSLEHNCIFKALVK